MRHGHSEDSRVTLPITPMLDMTFQLLFFAVMNFHPADLEGQMEMALPGDGVAAGAVAVPEPGQPADFPASWAVLVRARVDGINDGEITSISVRNPEGKVTPVEDLAGLKKFLVTASSAPQKLKRIKIEGDGKLKVANLLRVIDTCRKAGIDNVGLASVGRDR